jgi:hypothetical protein
MREIQFFRIFFMTFKLIINRLLILFVLAFSACKKENNLGLPISPDPAFEVFGKKALRATAITTKFDSILTDEAANQLVGCIHDPILGISFASFANQFYLDNSAVDFGPNCTFDSLVVSYAYATLPSYYGPKTKLDGIVKLKVFELTNPINFDKIYYSNYNISNHYNANSPVGELVTFPQPDKIPTTEESNPSPQIRIKLSAELGQRILNASASGTNQLRDNSTFQNLFKGLFVTAEDPGLNPGQGSILYFDLLKPSSKLTLFYRDAGGNAKNFSFGIKNATARFNMFKHNYSGYDTYNQLNGLNTDTSRLYVQTMAGLKPKIQLPFLNNFKDSGNIAINKCEIEFVVEPNLSTLNYLAFDRLFLTGVDSSGGAFILDDQIDGLNFGGEFNPSSGSYKFNISRYAQQVVSGKRKNYGLYLVGGNAANTSTRVIIKGKENILVNLNYTKF